MADAPRGPGRPKKRKSGSEETNVMGNKQQKSQRRKVRLSKNYMQRKLASGGESSIGCDYSDTDSEDGVGAKAGE